MAKSPDAFRTIREVAEWLDTPAHVLRFWESRFSQVKPVKRAGGRRYYRPSDMELLGGIKQLLHEDGLTIRGVQKLLREQGVRYVAGKSQPLELRPDGGKMAHPGDVQGTGLPTAIDPGADDVDEAAWPVGVQEPEHAAEPAHGSIPAGAAPPITGDIPDSANDRDAPIPFPRAEPNAQDGKPHSVGVADPGNAPIPFPVDPTSEGVVPSEAGSEVFWPSNAPRTAADAGSACGAGRPHGHEAPVLATLWARRRRGRTREHGSALTRARALLESMHEAD